MSKVKTRSSTPQNPMGNNMMSDLKEYMAELIHNEMDHIRRAINDLTSVITEQNKRIEQLESRVSELERKNETNIEIQHDTSTLQNTIMQLKTEISDRDQQMLLNDVEIAGCHEMPNENCVHLAISIGKKVGLELDEKDIVSAYRAGPARPTAGNGELRAHARPIAVRFTRRTPRDAMLRAVRVRRNLTTDGLQLPGPVTPIYVNERLTKHNRTLFQKARSLARDRQYRYVWTRDGKVFVCEGQGKPRHRLRLESDLSRVFGKLDI